MKQVICNEFLIVDSQTDGLSCILTNALCRALEFWTCNTQMYYTRTEDYLNEL